MTDGVSQQPPASDDAVAWRKALATYALAVEVASGRAGRLAMDPDMDNEVSLIWVESLEQSGYIKVETLRPPTAEELAAAEVDALAASPFALLDARESLRLVTDAVHEDDALCLALACRALRDELWARFSRRPADDQHAPGKRLRTRDAAVVATVERLDWLRGLPDASRPSWLNAEGWQGISRPLSRRATRTRASGCARGTRRWAGSGPG